MAPFGALSDSGITQKVQKARSQEKPLNVAVEGRACGVPSGDGSSGLAGVGRWGPVAVRALPRGRCGVCARTGAVPTPEVTCDSGSTSSPLSVCGAASPKDLSGTCVPALVRRAGRWESIVTAA